MKQMLSSIIEAWRRAAEKGLFSLLEDDSNSRRTIAENDTELGEKLKRKIDEARKNLRYSRESDLMCARRLRVVDDTSFSGWRVNKVLGSFEKESL